MFYEDVPSEVRDALGGRAPTVQQWEAISAPLEPWVLIAGAGSGKTAVMAARMVWLIVNGHAKANEILGLTFTNKAAESLLDRVRKAIASLALPDGEEPVIATYHSFASGLIADYGLRAGVEPGAALLSDAQVWQLCAQEYLKGTYEHMEVRNLWHVQWIRNLADECANHLITPADLIAEDNRMLERIANSSEKISAKVKIAAQKRIELAGVVERYERAKRGKHVLDYGDQIRIASEIAHDEKVVADFLARFRFALLDEYQDTNHAQAVMLKRLMPDGYPVMAVGDPDQNIYEWRGASLHNLLAFSNFFVKADGSPARVLPLEVNFRSGRQVLELANTSIEGVDESRRPPGKVLRHYPELGEGEIAVGLYTDEVTEAEAIVAEVERCHDSGTTWGEIAVLCRKKRLFGSLVEAFRAREIPLEVIGLGGLLKMPEVTDLVALLRVIDDPMRNVALARLLRGPRWRIGHRDLALIGRHAAEQNRGLKEMMEVETPGDVSFSLAEAIAALDQVENVSPEARARISRFNAELAVLRAAAHLPLPELASRALDMLGIARELDASPSQAAAAARRNIANFLDRVAAFEPLQGEQSLSALVQWLDAVEEADEDIEAAQATEADSVKLMTIHQAKGLEYDVVFIPGLARGERSQIFPDTSRRTNPAASAKNVPIELRGDRDVFPRFMGNLSKFNDELKERALEEELRLLYVAITRARKRLVCTASHWYFPSGMDEALTKPLGASEFWQQIREFPNVEVLTEVSEAPQPNPLIARRAQRATAWPPQARRAPLDAFPEGLAAAVRSARATTAVDLTLFPPIESAPTTDARALAVTSVVTYAMCPRKFYWSSVRPLPRRGSAAARLGTIVHSWIEQEGKGQIQLVDPDEFELRAPAPDDDKLAALKSAFRSSRFHGKVPAMAERSFALVIGEFVVHGRIDAIFDTADGGWEIVDWKSGRAPSQPGAERWQLDLYALAAQEIWGRSAEELTVSFVYLGDGTEHTARARPADQIRADLASMLAGVEAGAFDPVPSLSCRFCDFKRDCGAGAAFLASQTPGEG